jgi:hypothetical protein
MHTFKMFPKHLLFGFNCRAINNVLQFIDKQQNEINQSHIEIPQGI